MERGAANIGIAWGLVKQKIVSTSQIISKHVVRIFLHHYPQIIMLINVHDSYNSLK
jgi:hypothetical protein